MAQFGLPVINPSVKDGEGLAYDLNAWAQAIHSGHSGGSRPSYITGGMTWVKNSSNPWQIYIFDGTDDVLTGTLDITTNTYTPVGGGGGGTGVPGYVTDLSYSYTYGLGSMPTANLLKLTGGITAVDNTANAVDGEGIGVFVRDLRSSASTGTAGNVNNCLFTHTVTRNGLQNQFEWNGLFILDMLSSGPGEHCAIYTQANRYGTSGTWGSCLQVVDYREEAENDGLLWGAEIDCAVTGRRTNGMGISVVVQDAKEVTGRGTSADKRAAIGIGIGSSGGAKWELGQRITDFCVEGLLIYPGPTYSYTGLIAENGIRLQGDYSRSAMVARYTNSPFGIDLSEGNNFSNAAIALATNHSIKFGSNALGTDGTNLTWNGVAVGGGGGSGSSVVTSGSIAQFGSYAGDPNFALLTIPSGKRWVIEKAANTADQRALQLVKNLSAATGGGGITSHLLSAELTTGTVYAGREHVQDITISHNASNASNTNPVVATNCTINKNSTAGAYGSVCTMYDNTNVADSGQNTLIGHMVTLWSGGADGWLARNGLVINSGKNVAGATTYAGRGIFLSNGPGAGYGRGIEIAAPVVDSAFLFSGSIHSLATETAVFKSTGTAHKGINLRNSSHSTGIAIDIATNDAYAVNGTPVIKRQAGGWCKVIGSTSFYRNYFGGDFNMSSVDTSFVLADTVNLQGHVIALYKTLYTLVNDLRFHGQIGGNPNSTANASFQTPPT